MNRNNSVHISSPTEGHFNRVCKGARDHETEEKKPERQSERLKEEMEQ